MKFRQDLLSGTLTQVCITCKINFKTIVHMYVANEFVLYRGLLVIPINSNLAFYFIFHFSFQNFFIMLFHLVLTRNSLAFITPL